ncbi:MAG: RecQ family ATP-dependent DNA helicase [Ignavibacteria bacterium]|nr:RecQ family ATP-dependent DNA helicase [Ignavibacteria bacterium]
MPYSSESAHAILHRYFGYSSFREGQEEIISAVMHKRDSLAIMPTGGGKSLCYQIPAMMCDGTTLVVSPLIALMKDQTDILSRAKIPATFINSILCIDDIVIRLAAVKRGEYKLIYIAPKHLSSKAFLKTLKQINISFLAIDEAHCISEWGHDFRPAYLEIPKALETLQRVPIIALTATATPEVQDDIVRHLEMKTPLRIIKGFDRPNLTYAIEHTKQKAERITDICKETQDGCTIIYCGTRKRVEEFTEVLRRYKLYPLAYHAGLLDIHRKYAQEQFISGECKILIATSAFGMGIDKSDVRNVIHCDLTLTLEAYYQEAGRAGRDGKPSTCTMLYLPTDRRLMEFFLNHTYPSLETFKILYNTLYDLHQTPLGMKPSSPIHLDDAALANRSKIHGASVSSILNVFQRHGIVSIGSNVGLATLLFTTSQERVKEYFRTTTPDRQRVLSALLRSVGAGALSEPTQIDVSDMMYKHELSHEQFTAAIRALEYARLIKYEPPGSTGGISLNLERMPFDRLPIDFPDFERRRERGYAKLDIVQRYAETPDCKRNFILQYFQEETSESCGRCSACLEPDRTVFKRSERQEYLKKSLLTMAAELHGRFGRLVLVDVALGVMSTKIKQYKLSKLESFGDATEFTKSEILSEIDTLVSENILRLSADIHPTISLTDKGLAELSGKIIVPFELPKPEKIATDHLLIEALTVLRKDIAQREGVLPSAVVDTTSLLSIAEHHPTNQIEMRRIQGIGENFIARYSGQFLHLIRMHVAKDEKIPLEIESALPPTVMNTIRLAKTGKSLSIIATERDMTPATIAQHIQQALENGVMFNRSALISDELYELTRKSLHSNPRAVLREVRADIGSKYDFPELRVAVAFVRAELNRKR